MRKWEYLTIVGKYANNSWRVSHVNDTATSNWESGETLHQALNRFGSSGWEIVSETIDQNPSGSKWSYYVLQVDADFSGKVMVDKKQMNIMEACQYMGENLWELVAVSEANSSGMSWKRWLIFRSQISNEVFRIRMKREINT